jgi:hypothetical protein
MGFPALAPSGTYTTQSVNGLAAAGSLIMASNIPVGTPAAGTGVGWVAAQTSFSDTQPSFIITNNDLTKSLHLLCLKMVANAAGSSATSWQYAGVLDVTKGRTVTTNHFANAAVFAPNSNALGGTGTFVLPTVQYQTSTTASVVAASTVAACLVSRGGLGALNIVGDEFVIKWGTFDASGTTTLTAAEVAGSGTRCSSDGPVIIAPQTCFTLTIWGVASTVAFAPDFSFFMAAF